MCAHMCALLQPPSGSGPSHRNPTWLSVLKTVSLGLLSSCLLSLPYSLHSLIWQHQVVSPPGLAVDSRTCAVTCGPGVR
jgi:hypothetical protein